MKSLANRNKSLDILTIGNKWPSFIPICDPAYLLRKILTFMMNNDCVLDHGISDVCVSDILSAHNIHLHTNIDYLNVY